MEEDLKVLEEVLDKIDKIPKEALDEAIKNVDADEIYERYYKQKAEIEKKNKTIYKMASYIAQLDIDEDICSTVGTKDCDKMAFCECESCIIEYFTKLAEEEK